MKTELQLKFLVALWMGPEDNILLKLNEYSELFVFYFSDSYYNRQLVKSLMSSMCYNNRVNIHTISVSIVKNFVISFIFLWKISDILKLIFECSFTYCFKKYFNRNFTMQPNVDKITWSILSTFFKWIRRQDKW